MSNNANDAVGQLTIADATLCDLLRDILQETGGRNSAEKTTGKAADDLLAIAKRDPSLFTSDITGWLKRVKSAAEERNKVVHAIARDRCVRCGQATQFEHRGVVIDRSVAGVDRITTEFMALINDGVKLADAISARLNTREVARAKALAASTGTQQSPRQILIGQNWYCCASCSPTGVANMVVTLPTAVSVSPS